MSTNLTYHREGDYVIPDSVKSLDGSAFLNCKSLESIEVPPTESFNTDAINGCTGLSKIVFHGDMPAFLSGSAPFSGFKGTIFYPANNPSWLSLPDSIDTSGIVLAAYSFPGDVNLDGQLTNADLITVARYVVHLIDVFTPGYINVLRYGDMDRDGEIDNRDIISIARKIVGLK